MLPIIIAAASLIFVAISVADLCWRRIPNSFVLGLTAIAILRISLHFNAADAVRDLAAAAALFLLLLLAWSRDLIGAGDVKLIFAAALLVGYRHVPGLVMLIALLGGALSLLILVDRLAGKLLGHSAGIGFPAIAGPAMDMAVQKSTVPYGIAISGAAVWMLIFSPAG